MDFLQDRFNAGDAIAQLESAKKTADIANFDETVADIRENYQEQANFFSDIEKIGGIGLGGVAGIKGVYDTYKKIRSKFKGKSSDKDDAEDNDNEDNDNEEGDITATGEEDLETPEAPDTGFSQPQEIEMTDMSTPEPFDFEDMTPADINGGSLRSQGEFDGDTNMTDIFNEFGTQDTAPEGMEQSTYDDVISDFRGDSDAVDTAYPDDTMYQQNLDSVLRSDEAPDAPFLRQPTDDLGTQQEASDSMPTEETFTPADTTGDQVAGAQSEIATERAGYDSEVEDIDAEPDADFAGDVGDVGDVAGDVAEAGADAGLEAGLDTAGGVAEALGPETFGIGDVVGLILQGIGFLGAGGTAVAGLVGSDDAEAKEQADENTAKQQELQALATPPDLAGRFGAQAQSSIADFM
jgi:hypothetical protein